MKESQKIKFLMLKFLKPEDIVWPKETVAAKRLLKLYPRFDYWINKKEIRFDSLLCMLTKEAKRFMTNEYSKFCFHNPTETKYELSGSIEGENLIISPKPKTVIEFIDE